MGPPLSLHVVDWPEAERTGWNRAQTQSEGIFEKCGAAAKLRPDTLKSYRHAVGQFFSYLFRSKQLVEGEAQEIALPYVG